MREFTESKDSELLDKIGGEKRGVSVVCRSNLSDTVIEIAEYMLHGILLNNQPAWISVTCHNTH